MSDYQQHGRRHGRVVTVGAPGSDPPLPGGRLSYGQVFNDGGTIDAGSGDWAAASTGTGTYTVTFAPAFDAAPTVILTANNNNAPGSTPSRYTVEQTAVAADHVDVIVYDDTDTAADGGFNFLAIGT